MFVEERRTLALTKYDEETLDLKRKGNIQSDDIKDIVKIYFHSSVTGKE